MPRSTFSPLPSLSTIDAARFRPIQTNPTRFKVAVPTTVTPSAFKVTLTLHHVPFICSVGYSVFLALERER